MSRVLMLYAVSSQLAFTIASRNYQRFRVRCSPHFDSHRGGRNPPSADPFHIYHSLFEEVAKGDRRSPRIAQIRGEVLEEAVRMHEEGVINDEQLDQIKAMVTQATPQDFEPLVFVIPYHGVDGLAREVSPHEAASALAVEYVIDALPPSTFDVIVLRRS